MYKNKTTPKCVHCVYACAVQVIITLELMIKKYWEGGSVGAKGLSQLGTKETYVCCMIKRIISFMSHEGSV